MEAFEAIRRRRSVKKLIEPAPDDVQLRLLLEAAVLAPDHQELRPWRFFVLRGESKRAFGDVLAEAALLRQPEIEQAKIDKERTKLDRAPLVVVVAAKRIETKLPFSELLAAVSAATQNLMLAATASGWGSIWRTGDASYDPTVKAALGLDIGDEIVSFLYLGTPAKDIPEPRAAKLDHVVINWTPAS